MARGVKKKEPVFDTKGFDSEIYKNGWRVKNLRYFRSLRRISKRKLCDELNLNLGTYNDWEMLRVCPSLDKIVMLSDYLHVSVDVLIGRKTGSYEYQVELSNLLFALNTQFEIVQHKLEQDDKCVFEVGNLKVAISSRELGVQDRRLPDEKIMEQVLSNAEFLDDLYRKKEEEYRLVFEKREQELEEMLKRREVKFNEKLKKKEEELLKREERIKKKEQGIDISSDNIERVDFVDFTNEMITSDRLMDALKKNIGLNDVSYESEVSDSEEFE